MGQTEQVTARTNSLRLKLSPGMTGRLERLAETYGMPVSTLGALQWLTGWHARDDRLNDEDGCTGGYAPGR